MKRSEDSTCMIETGASSRNVASEWPNRCEI